MISLRMLVAVWVMTFVHAGWVAGEQLDETWTVTVNGQSVQVNPDGSFRIPNISSADLFGPGGPGTAPDFLSDDFVRLFGVSTVGTTRYAFSEPFQIRRGVTFRVGEITRIHRLRFLCRLHSRMVQSCCPSVIPRNFRFWGR